MGLLFATDRQASDAARCRGFVPRRGVLALDDLGWRLYNPETLDVREAGAVRKTFWSIVGEIFLVSCLGALLTVSANGLARSYKGEPYSFDSICSEGHVAQASLLLLLGSLIAHEVRDEWRNSTIMLATFAGGVSMLVSGLGTLTQLDRREFSMLTTVSLASFATAVFVVVYRSILVAMKIRRDAELEEPAEAA